MFILLDIFSSGWLPIEQFRILTFVFQENKIEEYPNKQSFRNCFYFVPSWSKGEKSVQTVCSIITSDNELI